MADHPARFYNTNIKCTARTVLLIAGRIRCQLIEVRRINARSAHCATSSRAANNPGYCNTYPSKYNRVKQAKNGRFRAPIINRFFTLGR